VSTHSFWVGIYSHLIYNQIFGDFDKYLSNTLSYALTHDFIEYMTGDIVRIFKYSSPSLTREIETAEKSMLQKLDQKMQYIMDQWKTNLDNDEIKMVKSIVKAADFTSLLTYMRRELMRGNREIIPFYDIMSRDLGAMTESGTVNLGEYSFDLGSFYSELLNESLKVKESYT